MLRTVGAVLIGGSAALMGFSLARQRRRQLAAVSALRDLLLRMQQKAAFYRLPLPALLRELSEEEMGPCADFCADAAARLEENRRYTAEAVLRGCLRRAGDLGLPEDALPGCERLFRTLARTDSAHLDEALGRVVGELDELEVRLRDEVRRRGRCSCAIGVCGGLALIILLV